MTAPLPVRLDRSLPTSLSAQLADAVRSLVLSAHLSPGDRLPSTRALAAELAVSRATVETAWDQLRAEGWVESRQGAGTQVSPTVPTSHPVPAPHRAPASPAPALIGMDAGTPWRPHPAPRQLDAAWRRAWRRVGDATPPRGYDDARGLAELRELLAARLSSQRGISVGPDDVLITSGTTAGLRQVLTALPDLPVGIEDPGYRAAAAAVLASGRQVVDLPATTLSAVSPHTGPLAQSSPQDSLRDLLNGVGAVYVTPAHQHPLGHVMGAHARLALLESARAQDVWVIEDDYDSEFRYDVAPIPALASLDRDRVVLLGTASKAAMPTLRLGWMVVPAGLRGPVDAYRALTHDTPPWAVQLAFSHLLSEGHVDATVRAARRVYATRALQVVEALSPYAELAGPVAGMYSTWLLEEGRAVRARDAAAAAGFRINLLSTYCRSAELSGLVVGFGGPDDAELDRALKVIAQALR